MNDFDRASQTKLHSAEAYECAIENYQTRRLQEIAERLQLSSEYEFGLEVSDELPEMQAYAVYDSNFVELDRKLVDSLSDDALAWVIAHEAAHLELDHQQKAIKSTQERLRDFQEAFGKLNDRSQREDWGVWHHMRAHLGRYASLGIGILLDKRTLEKEADARAAEIIVKAGFDPDGAIEALETCTGPLNNSYKIMRHVVNVFDTHPLPEVRAARIKINKTLVDH